MVISDLERSVTGLKSGLACGKFFLKLASGPAELESVQRLRFEVFNQELGEGLSDSQQSGLDQDIFDEHCDHLMLMADGKVVATYRLLHGPSRPTQGFYTETEFKIRQLPIDPDLTVELGRACIAPAFRMKTTLMSLFWGIHCYLVYRKARYLLGCASLSVTNDNDTEATYESLQHMGQILHIDGVEPIEACAFKGDADLGQPLIPPLLSVYLEFGAKVVGRPAHDKSFGCYDMLMYFDMEKLSDWGADLLRRFDKRLLSSQSKGSLESRG